MIDGRTELIAHIGHPTHTFKSPMIYNPYFEGAGIPAVVVPMACQTPHFPLFLRAVFGLDNVRGALITMPHKVSVVGLLDEVSETVRMAGSCNAVKRTADGRLVGDMFDGVGFVRALARQGFDFRGKRALVVGSGGVGSAIAASLAQTGLQTLAVHDVNAASAQAVAERLQRHAPQVRVGCAWQDPKDVDLVVNATPLGMQPSDPAPFDLTRLRRDTWVGEVVLSSTPTPLVRAAQRLGCTVIVGLDMLFEQIPAYLEFFGLPVATPDQLRAVARIPEWGLGR